MTAATAATAVDLRAGAASPHGHHERPDEGWDRWTRTHCDHDPDAGTCGRHDATAHTGQEEVRA